ncbi:hypothetical protein [Synechococcus sp. RS9916]|uniref:hypothetical protein n=1 Tax=Synechococcus sp. RS9916 TaxID=221359 RepID=UPI0000E53852|nr:hypothetical protein [Synechococcus sp. RS9916]EAU75532.1 hypothetical protein RS9916_38532 [Synechococcus sp. RS9916]
MVPALQPPPSLRWLLIASGLVGVSVLAAAMVLLSGHSGLPTPSSDAGRALLRHYNHLSHGLLLSGVGLTIAGLWRGAQQATTTNTEHYLEPPLLRGERVLRWCREHPLLLILFSTYTIAMVQSTSGFYPELQGWLREIQAPPLLDHFQLRDGLINETMRANSFRFFPLAHQDLHLLSWFTPYVKVWALVSALELVAIVHLANRAVSELSDGHERPGQFWLISLLLLFHPAIGWGFFQLIYSERLLTLLLAVFITALLTHQTHEGRSSFALAFSCALVGVFVKDIAVVLFVAPAAFTLLLAATGRGGQQRTSYALEWWLMGLSLVAIAAYGVLSLLPSLYAANGGFDSGDRFTLMADWRLVALLLFAFSRWLLIAKQRCQAHLTDGLNLAALAYATGLWLSVGYPYESFWTLPVQLITVLDLAFIWSQWVAPSLGSRANPALVGAIAIGIGGGVLALEGGQPKNFRKRISKIQTNQQKWQSTFEQLDHLLKKRRETGQPRNLIFMQTWFGRSEYERLPYERLIELNPDQVTYTVIDGIGAGQAYEPKPGDLLANIDKRRLSVLGNESQRYAEIYRFRPGMNYGAIYERKP